MDFVFLEWMNEFWLNNKTFIIVALAFMALDILTGILKSLVTHTFSTKTMRTGFGHKVGIILALCAIAIIQVALFDPHFSIDFEIPLFDVTCGLIILMEFCSVLENCCVMNPQLDNIIGKYFDKKDDIDTVNMNTNFGAEYMHQNLFDDTGQK